MQRICGQITNIINILCICKKSFYLFIDTKYILIVSKRFMFVFWFVCIHSVFLKILMHRCNSFRFWNKWNEKGFFGFKSIRNLNVKSIVCEREKNQFSKFEKKKKNYTFMYIKKHKTLNQVFEQKRRTLSNFYQQLYKCHCSLFQQIK